MRFWVVIYGYHKTTQSVKSKNIYMKKPTTVQFIVYSDGNEVIVCKPSSEKETLKLFHDSGRDLEKYNRKESYDVALVILPTISVY